MDDVENPVKENNTKVSHAEETAQVTTSAQDEQTISSYQATDRTDMNQSIDHVVNVQVKPEPLTDDESRGETSENMGNEPLPGMNEPLPGMLGNSVDYICDICGQTFSNWSNLKRHYISHSGVKLFQCQECQKTFTTNSNLTFHKRRVHIGLRPFKCDECELDFVLACDLARHKITHTGEKPHVCNVCGKAFNKKYSLDTHLRIHAGIKPYSCEVCGKAFCDKRNLAEHVQIHSGEKPWTCEFCAATFTARRSLLRHRTTHTGENSFTCKECNLHFSRKMYLESHKCTPGVRRPFPCSYCEKSYGRKMDLRHHMERRHGEYLMEELSQVPSQDSSKKNKVSDKPAKESKPKRHVCSFCEKAYMRKKDLRHHMERQHGYIPSPETLTKKSGKKAKPSVLGQALKSIPQEGESVVDDMKYIPHNPMDTELQDVVIKTEPVDEIFTEQDQSLDHVETGDGGEFDSIPHEQHQTEADGTRNEKDAELKKDTVMDASQIKEEPRDYESDGALSMRDELDEGTVPTEGEQGIGINFQTSDEAHSGEKPENGSVIKPINCHECHKSFTSTSLLRAHMRRHNGIKRYKCDLCEMAFVQVGDRNRHRLTHTGEKPHSCKICGKSFAKNYSLMIHQRIHTGEKPHTCEHCGKCFAHRENLSEHLKIHTGEKPWVCEFCGSKFHARRSLVRHRMTHIGIKPYECKVCKREYSRKSNLDVHKCVPIIEKPYLCDFCDRGYSHNKDLMRHVRNFHGDKIPGENSQHKNLETDQSTMGDSLTQEQTDDVTMTQSLPEIESKECNEPGDENNDENSAIPGSPMNSADVEGNSEIENPLNPLVTKVPDALAERWKLILQQRRQRLPEIDKPFSCSICTRSYFHNKDLRRHIRKFHKDQAEPLRRKRFQEYRDSEQGQNDEGARKKAKFDESEENSATDGWKLNSPNPEQSGSEDASFVKLESMDPDSDTDEDGDSLPSNADADERPSIDQGTVESPENSMNAGQSMEENKKFQFLDFLKVKISTVKKEKSAEVETNVECEEDSVESVNDVGAGLDDNETVEKLDADDYDDDDTMAAGPSQKTVLSGVSAFDKPRSPHACFDCGKTFHRTNDLIKHRRTHTGEKPYICEFCNIGFALPSNLKRHLRVHTGERPFVCYICHLGFTRRHGLKRHLKVHVRDGALFDESGQIPEEERENSSMETKNGEKDSILGALGNQNESEYVDDSGLEKRMMVSDGIKVEAGFESESAVHMALTYVSDQLQDSTGKYVCDRCDKSFLKSTDLKKHYRIHTGEKPYQCNICFKKFALSNNLMRHRRTHSGVKRYKCGHCSSSFSRKHGVKRHYQNVHPLILLSTEKSESDIKREGINMGIVIGSESDVDAELSTKGNVEESTIAVNLGVEGLVSSTIASPAATPGVSGANQDGADILDPSNVAHVCFECGKSFASSNDLQCHYRVHTGEKPYKCGVCKKSFSLQENLVRHRRIHTGQKRFKCHVCSRAFERKYRLVRHLKIHLKTRNDGEKPSLDGTTLRHPNMSGAAIGEESTSTSPAVKLEHNIEGIEDDAMHVSGPSQIQHEHDLVNAHLMHQPQVELDTLNSPAFMDNPEQNRTSHMCKICGKTLCTAFDLKGHYRVHTGEKPYECDECGKCFSLANNLSRHRRIHTGEKNYKCETCDQCFLRKEGLESHKKTHTGEKPFECQDCRQRFTLKLGLQRHRLLHTGERPYKCNHCDAAFRQSRDLICHQRIHTGEKPYQCETCGKKFRAKSYLITHRRIHSGEKPCVCDYCQKAFSDSSALRRHERTHTGEKPWVCEFCSQRFVRRQGLEHHRKSHIGQIPPVVKTEIVDSNETSEFDTGIVEGEENTEFEADMHEDMETGLENTPEGDTKQSQDQCLMDPSLDQNDGLVPDSSHAPPEQSIKIEPL